MVQPIRPRINFGRISDVTAFTYRDGLTHLQIQSAIRDKLAELIAFVNTLLHVIKTNNDAVSAAFDSYVSETIIPYEEYQTMTSALEILWDELADHATTNTDYVATLEGGYNG